MVRHKTHIALVDACAASLHPVKRDKPLQNTCAWSEMHGKRMDRQLRTHAKRDCRHDHLELACKAPWRASTHNLTLLLYNKENSHFPKFMHKARCGYTTPDPMRDTHNTGCRLV